jgi:hypothetical protein
VESTHRIVKSLNHRILLGDEDGLGKTVEAGLVIKELIYRHNYKKLKQRIYNLSGDIALLSQSKSF